MALADGTRLGPYEILSPIGAGGMGEVYRGKDTRLDHLHLCFLKTLKYLAVEAGGKLTRIQR